MSCIKIKLWSQSTTSVKVNQMPQHTRTESSFLFPPWNIQLFWNSEKHVNVQKLSRRFQRFSGQVQQKRSAAHAAKNKTKKKKKRKHFLWSRPISLQYNVYKLGCSAERWETAASDKSNKTVNEVSAARNHQGERQKLELNGTWKCDESTRGGNIKTQRLAKCKTPKRMRLISAS